MKKYDDIGFDELFKYPVKSYLKPMIIPFILSLLFISAIFLLFKSGNREINKEIKALKKQNDSLNNQNKLIFSKINDYQNKIEDANSKINELKSIDANYQYIIKDINKKMSDLKSQYEKANNHSSNFTSADIQRYFTDLK